VTPPFRGTLVEPRPRGRSSLGRDLSRLARVPALSQPSEPTKTRRKTLICSDHAGADPSTNDVNNDLFRRARVLPPSLAPRLKMHINISEALKGLLHAKGHVSLSPPALCQLARSAILARCEAQRCENGPDWNFGEPLLLPFNLFVSRYSRRDRVIFLSVKLRISRSPPFVRV